MKKVWNFVTTTILVILLLLVAIMFVPKIFGIEPMIVLSGSMEPTYHVGSLLYVRDCDALDIEVGDSITFHIDESTVVTHRVIEIDEVNRTFCTQGDANEIADGAPVSFDNFVGKPIFNIPKLGYLGDKLSTLRGKIIFVTIIVVDTILMFMGDFIWSEENESEKKTEKESKRE